MQTSGSGTANPSFIVKSLALYEELQKEIALCRRQRLEKLREMEECFTIANAYRNRLLMEVAGLSFNSQEEEIHFFKKIKPRFNAESEYYGLCCFAEMFRQGASDAVTLEQFYKREIKRLEKFRREHPAFHAYIMAGDTQHDAAWFIRQEAAPGVPAPFRLSNSLYDQLLGSLIALENYMAYIELELTSLLRGAGN